MVVASRPLRSGVRVASGYVCRARSMAAACEVEPRRGLQEGYVGLFLSFKKQEATNKEQDTHTQTQTRSHTCTLTHAQTYGDLVQDAD